MKTLFVIAILIFCSENAFSLEYEDDIMPFLAAKCGECHSKSEKAKGGLKLDDPKHLHARFENNSLVVPGDWDASLLFITLFRPADHKDAMPPKGKGERLTAAETRMVQQWIADGATISNRTGEKGPMPKPGELGYVETPDENVKPEVSLPRGEQDWTNTEGKTIRATLIRIEGDKAVLKLSNGQVYKYPLDKLSAESRANLPHL